MPDSLLISLEPIGDVAADVRAVAGFRALLAGVSMIRLSETGMIRVTGEDRVRWLNGMVTNSIQALGLGEGCYNFLLNAQGRIQGTAMAFAEAEALRLETDGEQVVPLMALLDRFIIMDDVELADVSAERKGLLLAGPGAAAMLAEMGLSPKGLSPTEHGLAGDGVRSAEATWEGEPIRVQRMAGAVVARYELWAAAAVTERLAAKAMAGGAVEGDMQSLEWLRMLEGRPRFGVDIRDRELPQETGQTDALHFSKGCYLGQEIVERIRSRGSVHRTFAGFRLTGELPERGVALSTGGKAVGELTSVAELPGFRGQRDGMRLALGYIRREALEGGQEIAFPGGTAHPIALPFHVAEAP